MEENHIHIPNGWVSEELGNLIKERRKSSLKVSDAENFGEYPFFTSGETVLQHTSKQLDGKNLFLATGGVANIKYYEGEASYSTDTYTITTKEEISTEYLYYDLLNIIDYINANYFQGSGLKHLQKKDLKKHQILFPEDEFEQTQIATILSKVDEALSQTQQLIAKYTRIKTGLMQDLLTKGIDEKGNIRSEETHEFKDSLLGRIPKEWECKMLGDIFDLKTGITPLRSNPLFFAQEGYNWVKTLDLNEEELFISEEKITAFALDKTAIKLRPIGTVLIAMYGGWQQIGRTSILKSEATTNQAITALVNSRIEVYSEFLQLFLQQNRWRWKQYAVSTRKDPNITKNDIAKFYFLYPKDIIEQKLVAYKILRAKELATEYSKQLSKLQALKTGLMQDLLSGKVRVNHLIKKTVGV